MNKKQITRLIIAAAALLCGIILIACGVMHWQAAFECSFKLTPDKHPAELYHLVTEVTALKPGSYTLTLSGDLGAGNGTQSAVRVDDVDGEILLQEVLSGGEENTFEFKVQDRIRQVRIHIIYDPASGMVNVKNAVISTDNVVYKESVIRQAIIAFLFILVWAFLAFRFVFPEQFREFISPLEQKINALVDVINLNNWAFWLLLLLILAGSAVFMLHYPGTSFWSDEMATIDYCNSNYSLLETLKNDMIKDTTVAPLFYLVANLWMKVSPYGTQWLLLICEVFTLAGILFAALAAREIADNIAGLFTALFMALMPYCVQQGGHEFRHYALWLLFTALTLFFGARKYRNPSPLNLVCYGLAATLAAYTHFSAVIFFFSLFLVDVFLFLKKRITIRHISSYLIFGVLLFPYLVFAYTRATSVRVKFWTPVPGFADFFDIMQTLLKTRPMMILYYGAVVYMLYRLIKGLRGGVNLFEDSLSPAWMLFAVIICCRLVTFIYSNLNPNFSMWWGRYFFCLMPCIGILLGLCCRDVLDRVPSTAFSICFAGMAVWLLVANCQVLKNNPDVRNNSDVSLDEPLEQAAEILRETDDLFNKDTAVYYSTYHVKAWQYFLALGDMTPGLINTLPMDSSNEDLSPYNVIYVMDVAHPISEGTWANFTESFNVEELNHDYKLYRLTRK